MRDVDINGTNFSSSNLQSVDFRFNETREQTGAKTKVSNVLFINSNLLAMARGGITIEDNAMIAANVQLISNNHDPYDLCTLTCKPVLIREYAWVGAGATILPGVCIGRHAIVGAGSVVTKDVPDYAVAVGNPAKVIKMLDKEKFQED
jgi:acetyltransferase-like isoleucine patch superfamily enzyme